MVDGIQGGDSVNLARQLGVVAVHANDCISQEFATLHAQAFAMITTLGILSKGMLRTT